MTSRTPLVFINPMDRREFIGLATSLTAGLILLPDAGGAPPAASIAQPRIPRRRGFNLTELARGLRDQSFHESDFAWMAGWGFDFARLPLSYWAWSDRKDWMRIDERALKPIDQAIEFGRQYHIHINLNFHRIPGYCVNGRELEPFLLFDSPRDSMERALAAAAHHWQFFAERYRGIPSTELSFDLVNEPPWMSDQTRYVEIVRALVAAIRAKDPDRLIVADGADIGQTPVPGIVDLGLVQSTRGYLPKAISHYTADWVPKNEFETFQVPTWPLIDARGQTWNKEKLRQELIVKWLPLTGQGVPVHVGEWGCLNHTPHAVTLAWMRDLLALWNEAGWGWAMWNLRGRFGVVDSQRTDVQYEHFQGHQLDRKMLELLTAA
ncbi:MAG TPA: cellulase family glycosylhydrolase [Opitutaceae bacterium]|nr:cellulase family glycosylhydrolase [Opitutaceae bacterium]